MGVSGLQTPPTLLLLRFRPTMNARDTVVFSKLKDMFPSHPEEQIKGSVLHPSNRHGYLNEEILMERCVDDLLAGRTAAAQKPSEDKQK